MAAPIKVFSLVGDAGELLELSLARNGAVIMLIHAAPILLEFKNERQYSIINALLPTNPFPEPTAEGRVRIWLKEGLHGDIENPGGENFNLAARLAQAEIIKRSNTFENWGEKRMELVEILVPTREFNLKCSGCGLFESVGEERWKRCSRCRLTYYVCYSFCSSTTISLICKLATVQRKGSNLSYSLV